MKIEIQPEQKVEEIKYPCLMISDNNLIVLMRYPKIGTALNTLKGICLIGSHTENWEMDNFKPFKGKITLENS